MRREGVIRLTVEERTDGSILVSSPDIPLLHLAVKDAQEVETVVLPVLREMLERRFTTEVDVRLVDTLRFEDESVLARKKVPPHVLARMTA